MHNYYYPAKLGILGGGQLGRMLIREAIDYDLTVHCLDPAQNAPCHAIAHKFVQGDYADYDTVLQFGQSVDKLTIEIEHVNIKALKELEQAGKKVYPNTSVIETVQDKGLQKTFFKENQIPTLPFYLVENRKALLEKDIRLPVVQKLRKEGYDGRGVKVLESKKDLENGFDAPSVIEEKAKIHRELSIQVCRNEKGEIVLYPVSEMVFHPGANLLDHLAAPAALSYSSRKKIEDIAFRVAHKLNLNGILAIELFEDTNEQIWVNELAPRPHNSGHHTMQACYTSQYGQLIRIISELPHGDPSMHHAAVMVNLLGQPEYEGKVKIEGLQKVMSIPHIYFNLYGKKNTRPYRKMGHVTILGSNIQEALQKAEFVKKHLKIIA